MYTMKWNVDRAALERMKQSPEKLKAALFPAMKQCMALAEATAKEKYLSGPRPKRLDRRTGRLRGSIATRVETSGNRVAGTIGTAVSYGRIWELGYKGKMDVQAHARTIRQAFGRAIKPTTVQVRAHSRQVDIQARPFLRPALKKNAREFLEIFRAAIRKAFS